MTKILATSDTHFAFDGGCWPRCDVFIHAGDIMYSGKPEEWWKLRNSLDGVIADTKYLVPGNHDKYIEENEVWVKEELAQTGIELLLPSQPVVRLPSGHSMLTIPFVVNLPRWSYNRTEESIRDFLYGWWPDTLGPDIVVSHCPPFGYLDKVPGDGSVGSKAMRGWVESLYKKPTVWICGHIHEGYGSVSDGPTTFYNVAHCNEEYQQVNAPMEIAI